MSQLKLTADSGGGTVAIKGPASTTGNAALELTVPGTGNATLLTSATSTGKLLQVVQTQITTVNSTASTSFSDTSLVRTITPSSASNKILCLVDMQYGAGHGVQVIFKLVRFDSSGTGTNIAYSSTSSYMPGFHGAYIVTSGSGPGYYGLLNAGVNTLDTAIDTGEHSYRVQWRAEGGTGYLNRTGFSTSGANYAPTGCSTITLMEIAA